MTREEAAKVLKLERDSWRKNPKLIVDQRLYDAINTAIEDLGQEPKSEWEQDHEILKAYSNGANEVLDKIRAEIENHCGLVKENHCKYCSYCNSVMGVREIIEIIDKYKAESEDKV